MSRGKRRRKITYDSNETRIVIGLLVLLLSGITLVSRFTQGIAFNLISNFFGGGTIVASVAFLILALRLFNVKPEILTNRSVVGMILITFAVCTFLSGASGLPLEARELAYAGEYGGIFGYESAQLIGDWFYQDFVQPLMGLIIFFSLPLVISIGIYDYISGISRGIRWFINKIQQLKQKGQQALPEANPNEVIPTMVGDFRDPSEIKKHPVVKTSDSDAPKDTTTYVHNPNQYNEEKTDSEYKYKESEGEASVLMQDELKYPDWKFPPINLLTAYTKKKPSTVGIQKNTKIIEQTLLSFGVKAQVVDVLIGPSVTQYALNIALGTKVSKISNLRNDLALALATTANGVRIEAPIPGTSFVGIETPNVEREMISFRELAEDHSIKKGILNSTLGKNVPGENIFGDIQKMPHLLIAGATGSGKSVVTNSFIMSLLMNKTPDDVRFIMVDPKQVELSDYNGIPHLLTPVITEMEKVNNALKWAIAEMERRYTEFRESKVRNIEGYNQQRGFSAIPYIVIVIDEMADMMMTQHGAEIESCIVKLAQKARATGIHLILATQRPSVDVITGLIKANIPGRIGMSVTTQIDSRVILDQIGAESLLGKGDMLYKDPGKGRLERIQGVFVSQEEVIRVVNFIKEQAPEVEYSAEVTKTQAKDEEGEAVDGNELSNDDLFEQAARIVVTARKGSSSLIQRKLSIGFNRAARLLDELEEHGIVGPARGSKPRDILVTDIDAYIHALKTVPQESE